MAVQCCCACMQGGGNLATESTAKNKNTNKTPQRHRRACSTKRAGGGGTGRSKKGRRGTAGGAKKKLIIATKNSTNKDRRPRGGMAGVTGGAGARQRDPPQVLTGKHHASGRGREGGTSARLTNWTRQGSGNGGPAPEGCRWPGKKNGMQGKGDGTEKGLWLEPHDGPRGLGRHGRRHRSKGRGREGRDAC